MARANEILEFWFGDDPAVPSDESQRRWFSTNAVFDDLCRSRFLDDHERAAAGQLDSWKNSPASCLALLLLLDQFPRNMFRDSPRAFATDPLAREIVKYALGRGFDRELAPSMAIFFLLPLEHSENLAEQDECVRRMRALVAVHSELAELLPYAEHHRETIARFGRFPHRNAVLRRASTPEEIEFLKQPPM